MGSAMIVTAAEGRWLWMDAEGFGDAGHAVSIWFFALVPGGVEGGPRRQSRSPGCHAG